MKKLFIGISIVEAIAIIILYGYLSLYKNPGFYDGVNDRIFCTNRKSCLHEIGHKLDAHSGYISKTEEYRHSVDVYRAIVWNYSQYRDEFSLNIYEYPGLGSMVWQSNNPADISFWNGGWGGYGEFYAEVIVWSDGKPEKCSVFLRDFYDWEFIRLEMEKLGYSLDPKQCRCNP